MESCNNFEHVVETSLQHCILQPLSHYVYLRIDEHFMEDGALFQVQRSVHQGKNKTPEEMGIRVRGRERRRWEMRDRGGRRGGRDRGGRSCGEISCLVFFILPGGVGCP